MPANNGYSLKAKAPHPGVVDFEETETGQQDAGDEQQNQSPAPTA